MAAKKPARVLGYRPTNVKGTNPKDIFGTFKVPLAQLSPEAQILWALGAKVGDRKYGAYNYRVSKVQATMYLEAAKRHIELILSGEDYDREEGIPHIGLVMATSAIYADAWINGNLIDNRPIPGRAGELMAFFNEKPDEVKTPEELREGLKALLALPRDTTHMSTESAFHALNPPEDPNAQPQRKVPQVQKARKRGALQSMRTAQRVGAVKKSGGVQGKKRR